MKLIKYIMLVAVLAGGVSLTGCQEKGPAESAGESLDKAAEKAGDAAKDAGEAAKDAGEKAKDAVTK